MLAGYLYAYGERASGTALSQGINIILATLFTAALSAAVLLVFLVKRYMRYAATTLFVVTIIIGLVTYSNYKASLHTSQLTLDYDTDGIRDHVDTLLDTSTMFNDIACHVLPSYHLLDLLPTRSLNFYVGSMSCNAMPIFSSISASADELEVNCVNSASYQVVVNEQHSSRLSTLQRIDKHLLSPSSFYTPSYTTSFPSTINRISIANQSIRHLEVFCGPNRNYYTVYQPNLHVNARTATASTANERSATKPNVIVIFVDALSRLHAYRRLPRTVAVMQAMLNSGQHDVYDFTKYNTVDYHTRGNLQALLCNANMLYGRQCVREKTVFNSFRAARYVTTYISDDAQDMIVEHLAHDKAIPGDGSVDLAAAYGIDYEQVDSFAHSEYANEGQWNNFRGPYSMTSRCIAGRNVHTYAFDALRQFVTHHDGQQQYFAFLNLIEAHEGSLEVIGSVDEDLAELLMQLYDKLKVPPVVLLVSDHGNHMGPLASTTGGRHESHLPAAFLMLPRSHTMFDSDIVRKALRHNQGALITAHNLYFTLQRLAQSGTKHLAPADQLSIFDRIPPARSCQDANIHPELCACGAIAE